MNLPSEPRRRAGCARIFFPFSFFSFLLFSPSFSFLFFFFSFLFFSSSLGEHEITAGQGSYSVLPFLTTRSPFLTTS
jgi:hypothetical protein